MLSSWKWGPTHSQAPWKHGSPQSLWSPEMPHLTEVMILALLSVHWPGGLKLSKSIWLSTHRIHGAGIYANIWGILIGSMLPYIAAPWILWGKSLRNIKNQTRPQNKATKATTVVGMTRKSVRDGQNGRIPDATHKMVTWPVEKNRIQSKHGPVARGVSFYLCHMPSNIKPPLSCGDETLICQTPSIFQIRPCGIAISETAIPNPQVHHPMERLPRTWIQVGLIFLFSDTES